METPLRAVACSPRAFLSYCLLRSFPTIKETSPLDGFVQLVSAFLGAMAVAIALKVGVRFKELVYAQVASSLLQSVLILTVWARSRRQERMRFATRASRATPTCLPSN